MLMRIAFCDFVTCQKNEIFLFFMKIKIFRCQVKSGVKINGKFEFFMKNYIDLCSQIVSGSLVGPEIDRRNPKNSPHWPIAAWVHGSCNGLMAVWSHGRQRSFFLKSTFFLWKFEKINIFNNLFRELTMPVPSGLYFFQQKRKHEDDGNHMCDNHCVGDSNPWNSKIWATILLLT